MIDLKELMECAYTTAKGIVESGQEAAPMFLVVLNEQNIMPICTPWRNAEEKRATFAALRETFMQSGVMAYVFICEAWSRRLDTAEPWDGTPPSEDPQRIEVLQLIAVSRSGERLGVMAHILTDDLGRRTVARQVEIPGATLVGNATELLNSITMQ